MLKYLFFVTLFFFALKDASAGACSSWSAGFPNNTLSVMSIQDGIIEQIQAGDSSVIVYFSSLKNSGQSYTCKYFSLISRTCVNNSCSLPVTDAKTSAAIKLFYLAFTMGYPIDARLYDYTSLDTNSGITVKKSQ